MLNNSDTFAILDGVGQGEGQGDPQGVSHWIGDDRTATDGSVSLVPQYSDSEDEDIVLVSESPTDCKWFQILISILGFGFYTWASGHGVGLPLLLYTCSCRKPSIMARFLWSWTTQYILPCTFRLIWHECYNCDHVNICMCKSNSVCIQIQYSCIRKSVVQRYMKKML